MGVDYTSYGKREVTTDVVVAILYAIGYYAVFLGFMFLISFVFANKLVDWHITWVNLMYYAAVPTVLCEIGYIVNLVRKRKKEAEMRDYTQNN